MLELLVAIGIIGVIVGMGTPLYVDWRANALNAEAVRMVQNAIATSRVEAKRTGVATTVVFTDEKSTLVDRGTTKTLPHGGTIEVSTSPLTLTFVPPFGGQSPADLVESDVTTGSGPFARTARLTVIPPLGNTAVSR